MKKSRFPFIALLLVLLISYLPIVAAVLFSFNESKMSTIWTGFSLRWYVELFHDREIRKALVNSLVLGCSASLISAAIATGAALAFRKNVPLKKFVSAVSMAPIMVPDIILGMVFLAYFKLLHLPFGMLTLLIAHVSFCIPHCYLQISARVAAMDNSPAEASRVLGASQIRAFFDVVLPYLLPAIASGMFISFAMSFDDVIISMFVTGATVNTLPIKVYSQVKTAMTPEINCLCTVMVLVAIACLTVFRIIKKKYEV